MSKFVILTTPDNKELLIDKSRILKCSRRISDTEISYKLHNQISKLYCRETPSEILNKMNNHVY